MFSLYPSPYTIPQHSSPYPYYYSDYNNDRLPRDYLHALAQQQARQRQEAQYRAQLEEARRRRAYQEALEEAARSHRLGKARRCHNSHHDPFMNGSSFEPYESFFRPRPQPIPREYSRPVRRDTFEDQFSAQMERRDENPDVKQQERQTSVERSPSSRSPPIIPEAKAVVEQTTPSSSPDPDPSVRDAAARTIQSFTRAWLTRLSALRAIDDICRRFEEAKTNFEFPSTLDFAEDPSSVSSSSPSSPLSSSEETAYAIPTLLYSPRNAPLHGHEHALVKLLSNLDAVESRGDARVRRARKGLVVRIERELGTLDAKKMDVWKGMVTERAALTRGASGDRKNGDREEGEVMSLISDLAEAEDAEEMDVRLHLCAEVEVHGEENLTDPNVDAQGNSKDVVHPSADQDAGEKCVVALVASQEDMGGEMDADGDVNAPVEESS